VYHSPTPLFKSESCNLSFAVDAQGSLLRVSLQGQLKRQQKQSVAADYAEWIDARLAGQSSVIKSVAKSSDPFKEVLLRVWANPPARLVDFIATTELARRRAEQARRGRITEFSKKSRMRLLCHGARLKKKAGGRFLTFTYRENKTDIPAAKHDLELMLLWLKRKYPQAAFIWRMEYQGRGAIHFHVLALNVYFIPHGHLTRRWQEITGDDSYPDNKPCRSKRKTMYYISKYLAKNTQAGDNVGINASVPSDDSGLVNLPYSDNYTGRWWGVINRKALPLASQTVIIVSVSDGRAFYELKRYARRKWRYLSRRIQGFTLFVNNPERWLELLEFILIS